MLLHMWNETYNLGVYCYSGNVMVFVTSMHYNRMKHFLLIISVYTFGFGIFDKNWLSIKPTESSTTTHICFHIFGAFVRINALFVSFQTMSDVFRTKNLTSIQTYFTWSLKFKKHTIFGINSTNGLEFTSFQTENQLFTFKVEYIWKAFVNANNNGIRFLK